ncbi:MAG: hypothetical protein ACXWPM_07320 [Bdellovibrionota bacterium]
MRKYLCRVLGNVLGSALVITGLMGCAGTPPRSSPEAAPVALEDSGLRGPEAADSSVDISYILGRDHYRLLAKAERASFSVASIMDKQVLEKNTVAGARYQDFLKKVNSFVSHPKRTVASNSPCHSPFSVTVRIGKETQTASGCRESDEGGLSRLVKDGEFLLYSKVK